MTNEIMRLIQIYNLRRILKK